MSILWALMRSKHLQSWVFLDYVLLLSACPSTKLSCTMLIRAQECYKWLPLFSVQTKSSALWISSSSHITTYIENFVHDNECYADSMQHQL